MKNKINAHENILSLVGKTPLIKLNRVTSKLEGSFYAKYEAFNPGHSNKDRIALHIIESAEKKGLIDKDTTIIETTSGNTGFSLSMVSMVKGYKCIVAVSSKSSPDKIDMLKSMGAKVYVCPSNVPADDKRSYYQVAKRLNEEIKDSFYVNQYFNELNIDAHYETTGPEIWNQTNGNITHLIASSGTGGTISGIGRFLKEKNNKIKIWGIDSFGSIFKKYHETGEFDKNEIYPYLTEGIGEVILPENVDFKIIDHFEKVTDENAAIYARRLAKKEGILAGYSCGAAIAGLHQLKSNFKKNENVVVLLHDSGTRYIGKVYNDEWMKKQGFKLD